MDSPLLVPIFSRLLDQLATGNNEWQLEACADLRSKWCVTAQEIHGILVVQNVGNIRDLFL